MEFCEHGASADKADKGWSQEDALQVGGQATPPHTTLTVDHINGAVLLLDLIASHAKVSAALDKQPV